MLNRYPVEVLAIKETSTSRDKKDQYWARWLDACKTRNLPNYVIVAGTMSELVENNVLQSKPWRQRYTQWGYEADFWFVRGHEHGGVVRQDQCMLLLCQIEGIREPAYPKCRKKM
jgi:hypothetical protein